MKSFLSPFSEGFGVPLGNKNGLKNSLGVVFVNDFEKNYDH